MANQNDDNLDFEGLEDLMPDGGDFAPVDIPDDFSTPDAVTPLEEPAAEVQPEPGTEEVAETEPAAEKTAAKSLNLSAYVDWAAAVGVAVAAVLLALIGFVTFGTAVYAVGVVVVLTFLWKERRTNSIYNVLLGCALIALLTAIYCLWTELGRYHFDIRAKHRASVSTKADDARTNC